MTEQQTKDFVKERAWLSDICDSKSTKELENKYDSENDCVIQSTRTTYVV